MRTCLQVVARAFAAFFALFFVFSAVLALILFNLGNRLFEADLYKAAFLELNVYQSLPGLVGRMLTVSASYDPCAENPLACEGIPAELQQCYERALGTARLAELRDGEGEPTPGESALIQSCLEQFPVVEPSTEVDGGDGTTEEGGMPAFMQNLTAENWEFILRIVIPPDELQAMTESVLEGVFAYLDGDVEQVTLSLLPLKMRLSGSGGDDLILELITSQPDCTLEDLFAAIGETASESLVLCNPPEELLPLALIVVRLQLNAAIEDIPDQAVILKPAASGSASGGGPFGSDPTAGIRILKLVLQLSPLVPFGFLALVTLFAVRSLKGWLRWWGIPFFFAGGIGLVLGLALRPVLTWAWTAFVAPRMPPYLPVEVADLGRDLSGYVAHDMAVRILLEALLLLLLGLAGWIISYFIKTKKKLVKPALPAPTDKDPQLPGVESDNQRPGVKDLPTLVAGDDQDKVEKDN